MRIVLHCDVRSPMVIGKGGERSHGAMLTTWSPEQVTVVAGTAIENMHSGARGKAEAQASEPVTPRCTSDFPFTPRAFPVAPSGAGVVPWAKINGVWYFLGQAGYSSTLYDLKIDPLRGTFDADKGDKTHWDTAVRECYEESGVLRLCFARAMRLP
jgi:hypothetical protein